MGFLPRSHQRHHRQTMDLAEWRRLFRRALRQFPRVEFYGLRLLSNLRALSFEAGPGERAYSDRYGLLVSGGVPLAGDRAALPGRLYRAARQGRDGRHRTRLADRRHLYNWSACFDLYADLASVPGFIKIARMEKTFDA